MKLTIALGLATLATAGCASESDAQNDLAGPETTADVDAKSDAERALVDATINGEEELVSIDLKSTGEHTFAGPMRYLHPVGGDVTADCTMALDDDPDGTPFAKNYRCDVREE